MSHSHRPTTKQQHKPFKSRGHATSRTLKDIAKGKIQPEKSNAGVQKTMSKIDRKNMAKQIQQNKKTALKAQASFFGDGRNHASRVCALISLSSTTKPKFFVNGIQEYLEEPLTEDANTTVHIKRFRQKLQFLAPTDHSLEAILDIASIADYTIFLAAASELLAENNEAQVILRALQSQGISTHFTVIPDLRYDPDLMIERTEKQCAELRKTWEADLERTFPVHHATSLYVMDNPTEIANMVRSVCTTVPNSPTWRSRAYIVPDRYQFEGSLLVEGIVRGGPLDVDRMIHISGFGDYTISEITAISSGIEEAEVLASPSTKQDKLNVHDIEMETEYEAPEASVQSKRGVRLDDHYYLSDEEEEIPVAKKLPKGTSEYQATWITDTNITDESSDEEIDMSDSETNVPPPSTYAPTQAEEAHMELSDDEEARQLAEYRNQVKDDAEFPDEVDFDPEIPARERFHKYRALKEFRSSHWDPEEIEPNTPSWYKQILKFSNYKATRNRVLNAKAGIPAGTRVRLHLEDVPQGIMEKSNIVLWSNREFEHARAINNMTIQLESGVDPIKSKSNIIIQVGHRRFNAQPVFSQNISRTSNNLIRYEKFARSDKLSFATFAGPAIMEKGAPVLYFSSTESGLSLIGRGSFVSIDHSRLLIKRILLSGEPYKIHKRLVTVRYMFHNREDIKFFKAVQLKSKSGRTGYIKEALGTHGYMKTTWDKTIQGQDTVLLPLYKRIYPRDATYYRE